LHSSQLPVDHTNRENNKTAKGYFSDPSGTARSDPEVCEMTNAQAQYTQK